MKINGFQIKETIGRWLLQRDTLSNQFRDNLYAFEGEEKPNPENVMKSYDQADRSMARVQEIQQLFNQVTKVEVQGETITLALCVKLVGGAGRRAKMWRDAGPGKQDRYSYRDESRERNKDTDYAKRLVTVDDCVLNSIEAAKYASALRNAIARGNSTDIECEKIGITEVEHHTLFE